MLLVLATALVSQNSPQHPEIIRAQRHARVIADAERSKVEVARLMAETDALLAEVAVSQEWRRAGERLRQTRTAEDRAEAQKALEQAAAKLREAEGNTKAVERRNAEAAADEKAAAEKREAQKKAEKRSKDD